MWWFICVGHREEVTTVSTTVVMSHSTATAVSEFNSAWTRVLADWSSAAAEPNSVLTGQITELACAGCLVIKGLVLVQPFCLVYEDIEHKKFVCHDDIGIDQTQVQSES